MRERCIINVSIINKYAIHNASGGPTIMKTSRIPDYFTKKKAAIDQNIVLL